MRIRSRPVLCNYYVTYRCNASCHFCDIWERPSPYVTFENVKENLRDLKKLGVKIIDFTGGEPLLHRELSGFLQLAKDFGFITTVTTNTLLYPKYADKLAGNIDMLHFSLDSPEKDEHNASRGVNCFDHILDSIKKAKELGEKPDIIFTVTDSNVHQIEEVYRKFIIPNNIWMILNPVFSYNEVGNELNKENLKELASWGNKKHVYLNNAFLKLRENGGNHIDDPVCLASDTTIVISPENKLIMPCYHLEMEALPINGNLYQLRKSDEVKQLAKMQGKHEACEGCTVNCYFEPSFAVNINKYWFYSLPSTLKYSIGKGILKL